ncbi:MAG: type II toxin-antitoxin system HicA family toxin [Cyanobacteriota bacterium]|nr:type II toxin-antitoxin system HicA family toxin [Cyanobacteriota bacterium]
MPKLPRLPASAVIAALQRLGFEIVRQKGSHVVLRRQSPDPESGKAPVTCVVPGVEAVWEL